MEIDIEDTKEQPQGGTRYLLVLVLGIASKLLFGYPLPIKGTLMVA